MLAATFVVAGVALTQPAAEDGADRYIVVLEDDVDHPSQVASEIEQRQVGVDVGFVYGDALEGFSAEIPDEDLAAVRADPNVDYVEPDGRVHAVQTLPWGIDNIGADESSTVSGNGSGTVSGVRLYVLDTGVYKKHPELNVVVPDGDPPNFAGGRYTDCGAGHGTHVAGVLAARDNARGVVGVAPGAPVTSVKVIGCNGPGFISNVIAGINWMIEDMNGTDDVLGTADDKAAVASLSLSGPPSETLDRAIRESAAADPDHDGDVDGGIFYAVAAGNDGKNACDFSPAAAGRTWDGAKWIYDNGVVTTAAVREGREETTWSNYGPCVDLWAPGKDILSTKNEGGTSTMSGTSMAAPHVGGTAALYLSNNPEATPPVVEDTLKLDAARVQSEDKRSKDDTRIKIVYAGDY